MLKKAFMLTLVLVYPNPTRPFQVETNASDVVIGVLLSQLDDVGTQYPVAYPKFNYLVYDKELVAIISTFVKWWPYLAGVQHRIQVVTNHKSLI